MRENCPYCGRVVITTKSSAFDSVGKIFIIENNVEREVSAYVKHECPGSYSSGSSKYERNKVNKKAFSVSCPICKAKINEACVRKNSVDNNPLVAGRILKDVHRERYQKWRGDFQ